MNEAEYLMKNCGDQAGCYQSRPWAKAYNTLREGEGVFDISVFPLGNEFNMKVQWNPVNTTTVGP